MRHRRAEAGGFYHALDLNFRVKSCFVAEIHLWITVLSIYDHNACVILLNFIERIWSSESLQTMRGILVLSS